MLHTVVLDSFHNKNMQKIVLANLISEQFKCRHKMPIFMHRYGGEIFCDGESDNNYYIHK